MKIAAFSVISLSIVTFITGPTAASAQAPLSPPDTIQSTRFDKAGVQRLLDTIQQDSNHIVLWGGFYGRGGTRELSLAEGLEMLRASLAKEPPGTLRWYRLQYQAAYPYIRLEPQRALDTWEAVFDQAITTLVKQELTFSHTEVLAGIINEFIGLSSMMSSQNASSSTTLQFANTNSGSRLQVSDKSRLELILAKAYRCWSAIPEDLFPGKGKDSYKYRDALNWRKAAQEMGDAALRNELKRLAADAPALSRPRDGAFLLSAGEILRDKEPDLALKLLREARAKLPAEEGERGKEIWARYREVTIETCMDLRQWSDAFAMEREIIRNNKRAVYEKFGRRVYESGRWSEFPRIILELKAPDVPGPEIVNLAGLLYYWANEKRSRELRGYARELYRFGLDSGRATSPHNQLYSRGRLAQIILDEVSEFEYARALEVQKKLAQARAEEYRAARREPQQSPAETGERKPFVATETDEEDKDGDSDPASLTKAERAKVESELQPLLDFDETAVAGDNSDLKRALSVWATLRIDVQSWREGHLKPRGYTEKTKPMVFKLSNSGDKPSIVPPFRPELVPENFRPAPAAPYTPSQQPQE